METDSNTHIDLIYQFHQPFFGKKDITDTYSFSDVFSKEEINFIIDYCSILPTNVAEFGSDNDKETYVKDIRSSSIRWVPINENTRFIYERLKEMIFEANREMWGFDIIGVLENIQYTEYYASQDGRYDWHLDIGPGIDYRKISITIQLSEPDEYEGGELQFLQSKHILNVPKELGLATLFPSYLLHRVNNVKKGVRRSLVLWVTGPAFR